MSNALPPAWQAALASRKQHFTINSHSTLRLLHDEDPRVRCDRFGALCWFYWYGSALPTSADLAHMEDFSAAAGSSYWLARLMRDRGQAPQALSGWGSTEIKRWTAREGDLEYIFRDDHGLSPGLFLDQRQNRRWVRRQAKSKRVLNLFSYTGGFSLNAALGQAQEVVSVDTSRPTLNWSEANFELNGLNTGNCEFWKAEARNFLRGCNKRDRAFDLVICDPPSFSRSRDGAFKIERDLEDVLQGIDQILAPQGQVLLSTNFEKWKAEGFTRRTQRALPGYIKMELPQPDPDFTTDGEPLMKALALAKP
jgi:23S rRNA (cytosine1962-C5)-methyltransferase